MTRQAKRTANKVKSQAGEKKARKFSFQLRGPRGVVKTYRATKVNALQQVTKDLLYIWRRTPTRQKKIRLEELREFVAKERTSFCIDGWTFQQI